MQNKKILYPKIILDHSKNPFNFIKKEEGFEKINAFNFECGDQFNLYIKKEEGKIADAYFYGVGCALSKASTSLLIKNIIGKNISEIKLILNDFKLVSEINLNEIINNFPEREKCLKFTWETLKLNI